MARITLAELDPLTLAATFSRAAARRRAQNLGDVFGLDAVGVIARAPG